MLNAYALRPGGGGIVAQQPGDSALRPNPYSLVYLIFDRNVTLFLHSCIDKFHPFLIPAKFRTLHPLKLQQVFLTFFTAIKCIFQPLWAFFQTEKKIPYPFIYFSYWIPFPFIYLKSKEGPFRAEPPSIDRCRKYPPGELNRLVSYVLDFENGFFVLLV